MVRTLSSEMEELEYDSPIGTIRIAASQLGIRSIRFVDDTQNPLVITNVGNPHLTLIAKELTAYFDGNLQTFSCEIDPEGTAFQKRVWSRLAEIPFGTTKSYGQIAQEIGQPTASRAVGGANNRNPIPIVIPCHRVIGSGNSLVGFACGIWRKQWMLEHEGVTLPFG